MPDYSSPEYWLSRFQREIHFEWLGPGDIVLRHVAQAFGQTLDEAGTWSPSPADQNVSTPSPTKILHIGSGTSQISLSLRPLVSARIINIDYIESCLTQLRGLELDSFGDVKMEYEQLDMLNWKQVQARLHGQVGEEKVLIIDKSTSDAISCGPDTSSPFTLSPVPPVQILAIHLAALSAPGSTWLSLSYSASRFDDIGELWSVQQTEKVPTASGQTKEGVGAPEVWHTLFVLRRTQVPLPK